jgi:hypothetical protein
MTTPELDLAALDLSRRLASGETLEQALDAGDQAVQTPERTQEVQQYAQAQQRLEAAAEAAVRGK